MGGFEDNAFNNPFSGRKSEQVAYFMPYKGHIHNPGMGIDQKGKKYRRPCYPDNPFFLFHKNIPPTWIFLSIIV